MTLIEIIENEKGINYIKCSGHTGYAEYGSDIVCAAVSSIVQTAMLGVEHYSDNQAEVVIDEDKALFELKLPVTLDNQVYSNCQIILNTMKMGLMDLAENYNQHIKLNFSKS